MRILIAIFLTFIFNQKEKRAFIWPKTFDFLFQKNSNIFLKKICSLKISVPEFQKYKKKFYIHKYFFKNFA